MRFMIMVRADEEMEAGGMPSEAMLAAMARYHEELAQAGVLLDAAGLQPSAKGVRIRFSKGTRTVVDGPFAETKELIGGYTLIQTRTREEAIEWARRMPFDADPGRDAVIEVRPLFGLDDFGPSESVERFRSLGVGGEA